MITWRLFLTSRNKLTRSSKTGPLPSRLRRSRQSKGALQCRRATNEDVMLELLERQQGCGEVYAMRPNMGGFAAACALSAALAAPGAEARGREVEPVILTLEGGPPRMPIGLPVTAHFGPCPSKS